VGLVTGDCRGETQSRPAFICLCEERAERTTWQSPGLWGIASLRLRSGQAVGLRPPRNDSDYLIIPTGLALYPGKISVWAGLFNRLDRISLNTSR